MRAQVVVVAVLGFAGTGCGDDGGSGPRDASPDSPPIVVEDAAPDAAPDASCETVLLTGGMPIEAQGWAVHTRAPAAMTYGADHVRIDTSTPSGSNTSGMMLMSRPGSLVPPFRLEVELLVERSSLHNAADAGVALLGAFSPEFGMPNERLQMIYVETNRIGWADNSGEFTAATTNAFHKLVLELDTAGNAAVAFDGMPALTRTGFTTNGTLALGDQTNDANVDGALQIRSVKLLCPL